MYELVTVRGKGTPQQNLACFVYYLKIMNTFLKNDTCILILMELKIDIEI